MKKPEIHGEYDPAGNYFLAVKCPECGETTRYAFAKLEPESKIACRCGVGFNLTQASYDAFKQAIHIAASPEDETLH